MKNIAQALTKFHGLVGKISKDSTNPFFKSNYASLSNVLEQIREPLEEAGLTFTQLPTGKNGLHTILFHTESGEILESTMKMTPSKDDPQGAGSALTYMRRYALVSILGLNVDDDDGNQASKKENLTPNSKGWEEAKKAILTGAFTIDQIKAKYSLTPKNEELLCQVGI